MNSSTPKPDSAAEEKASLWAARLDGSTLSATDRLELNAWLAENPAHRALLSQYCQFSADLEHDLPVLLDAGMVELPERVKRPRRKLNWLVPSLATAMAAAIVVFVYTRPHIDRIATATAQRQSLTLADGTRVDLNAHTSIAVEMRGHERHVQLAEGEAFFSVSKDRNRPFIVETPAGSVRVTGTVFDVRSEAVRDLQVLVVEGSVQVRPGQSAAVSATAPYALHAGDSLVSAESGVSVKALPEAAMTDALAWRQGEIVLNATPLNEALARFARYHGRGIFVAPDAAGLKVSGRYSLEDLDGFFANIEEILPVKTTRDLSGEIRVTLRKP